MSRRTYTDKRSYSAKVMRFRKAVYADRPDMTNGCRVLLLRLSDDMDAKGLASVPRSVLAADLGVAPARITEGIRKAKDLGFLDIVRRARPGVTAVYAAKIPATEVRPSVPSQRYARADLKEVRPGVPQSDPQRYALPIPQEGVPAATTGTHPNHSPSRRGDNDEPCRFHGWASCPEDCADHPDSRRRTA